MNAPRRRRRTGAGAQLALELETRPAFDEADFLIAACNRAAVAWVDQWPDWPMSALVVHGPAGCGKSHLAAVWRQRTGATPAAALAEGAVPEGAAVLIEDGDRVADEERLLHLYNRLAAGGGSLLLTARQPPSAWTIRLADLRSRIIAMPAAAIESPDDSLLAALLVKHFDDRQLEVPKAVLFYVLPRMERSFRAARAIATEIDRAQYARGGTITVPFARDALAAARARDDDDWREIWP